MDPLSQMSLDLASGQDMWKDIVDALPIGIMACDAKNSIIFVGAATESLLQVSAANLRNKKIEDVFGVESGVVALLEKARLNANSVAEHDLKIKPYDRQHVTVDLYVSPLQDNKNHFLLTFQSRAIPNIVDMQNTVKAASKSVSGLAAMLAHEIKNPLSGIRGAAQLIERRAADQDKGLPSLICKEVDRISALVNDLEAFTDPKPFEDTAVNIHEVLQHVCSIAKAGFGAKVAIVEKYDPSLPPMSGDFDRLVQVFLNLIKNSAEAMEGQDAPEITITTAFKSGVWIGGEGEKRRKLPFEVSLKDNGPGISPEIKDHIFDPFVTGREGGTGLGLALCAHYLAEMDGAIECDSNEAGTNFCVRLPAVEKAHSHD